MSLKQPIFRSFQCLTEDTCVRNYDLSNGSYLKLGEPDFKVPGEIISWNDDDDSNNGFNFFNRTYAECLWISPDINMVFMLVRKGLTQLEQAAIKADSSYPPADYGDIRKYVCEVWLCSRHIILRTSDYNHLIVPNLIPLIKTVLSSIKKLKDLPDYMLFNSSKPHVQKNDASYNYLHLSLDISWISLTFGHLLENDQAEKLIVFEKNLTVLLTDLVDVALRTFKRMNQNSDLSKHSPFLCSCFKELWLLIQLYVEQFHSYQFCKNFWSYFNDVVTESFNLQNSFNGKDAVVCLWLLYHVACIQGYDKSGLYTGARHYRVVSNFPLVEKCLKIITNINSTKIEEQSMCSCLQLLAVLQINWWKNEAKFELLQQLWEYFYKRLNATFQSSTEINSICIPKKSCDFVSLTHTILSHDLTLSSSNITSYDIFLCLLGKHLTVYPAHWVKIKGRIYSKLSTSKLNSFTDEGLKNLFQLFFVLAHTVNFSELTDKLQSILNELPTARSESNMIIWSAHISLFLMRVERGILLNGDSLGTEMSSPISLMVQAASSDRSRDQFMRLYIDGIKKLMDNQSYLQCQEHVLFGSWIGRYLQWCSHSNACYLLEILINLVKKLHTQGGRLSEWWIMFKSHVVPSIIQLSASADVPQQVTELAAMLITVDQNQFKNLIDHMNGDTVHISVASKFLKSLLEMNQTNLDHFSEYESIFIQIWVRIAVLNTDRSDLNEVTQVMTYLPNWSEIIGSFKMHSSEDPLYAVIRVAGVRAQNMSTFTETSEVKKWFETYFGRMDKWAGPVLQAAQRGENSQLVLRVYTTAALLCLHSAAALYRKNNTTCLFYRLISTLLLPSAVLMNRKPTALILVALRRTWHIFVRGMIHLDYKTDHYIERTFKDMVIRYVPHMYDASSPIIRCLDNEFDDNSTSFILEKISTTFLVTKSKIPHEFSVPALKLTLEMCRNRSDNIGKFTILIRTMLPSIFEQLMFVEDTINKQIVQQILHSIQTNNSNPEIKYVIKSAILNIIEKHLAFYSKHVYQLLEMIISILPEETEGIENYLRESVMKVENMRGTGYDNTLRRGLQRIQDLMKQQSK